MVKCAFKKMLPIGELKVSPRNRNVHPESQIKQLAKIIQFQGWRHPIIVSNLTGHIVMGHGRLAAAKILGLSEVPVDYQDFKDADEEYLAQVSDNAVALQAELDLSGINSDIGNLGPFDIDLLGIKNFVVEVADKEGECDEDEIPEYVEPRTKLGDLYKLGNHRLLCGDSTSIDAVENLMDGEKADMVFTDPPYNLGGEMDKGMFSNIKQSQAASKQLSDAAWDKNFDIGPVLSNLAIVTAENCAIYICTSHFLAGEIWAHTKEWCDRIGWCIWDKPNPAPSLQNRHWTWSAELICYATRGKHVFHRDVGTNTSNVWRIQVERHDTGHVAQKPVAIPETAITHSSNQGQLVLDLFGGSGTTMIACEKTNRKAYLMELDPKYCSVIVERWCKYTGQEAYLVNEDGTQTAWTEIKAMVR